MTYTLLFPDPYSRSGTSEFKRHEVAVRYTGKYQAMDALDPAWVQSQLSCPPFVTIEGVSNVRSLGNYSSVTIVGHFTKPNFMFRAGEISGITSTGKRQLEQLGMYLKFDQGNYAHLSNSTGIKKVFDLRSDTELEKFGSPIPELNSGAHVIRVPVFKKEDYSPEMIARRYKLYASGKIEVSLSSTAL